MSRPPGFFGRLRQRFVSTPRSNPETEVLRNLARHREALQIESGLAAVVTRHAHAAEAGHQEKNIAAREYIQYIGTHRIFLVQNGYTRVLIPTLEAIANNADIENDIQEMAREEIQALQHTQPPVGGGRRKRRATCKALKSRRKNKKIRLTKHR
jgi:hypothetical protein